MYISRPRIHKSDRHAAGARRLGNTLSHVHIASGFLFISSVDIRGRHRHQYPPPKEKTLLSTEKYPTSLPINAPLSSARIRPETQHLPTRETRCGTGSTAGHLHPAPPTWRLMRRNSRPLAHRGGGPSPRRPSADRAVPCMQRAAAGKADRAVGSVDGPTLLLAEVRSDLGKFDKWPILCLPVRVVDGGEISSHRGLEIEVSAPRTGPESRIRRHRSIVPFMWCYHFHFPISCAISCVCHIFPPGIDECHNCTGGSSGSPAPLSDQCCFRPSSPPLSRCNVPRKCQA